MRTPDAKTKVGTVAKRIGANIRRLRRARGWSHGQLATASDLPRALIWKIEQGAPRAGMAQLQPIAAALGVKLDDLAAAASRARSRSHPRSIPQADAQS